MPAPQLRFSTFPCVKQSKSSPLILSWEKFIVMLSKHDIRASKDGKLFSPAAFNGSRGNNNFISASGICLDFDHGQPTIEGVLALFPNTLAAYYSTHSHNKESPRFRMVLPLSRPVTTDEHATLVLGIKSIITPELMECIDVSCFDRARAHYLPSCPPEYKTQAIAGHRDGNPLNVKYFLSLGSAVATTKKRTARPTVPVKTPLPAAGTRDEIDTEGDKKKPPDWFTKVYPCEFSNDAYRALNRNGTAVMVLITCQAKHGRAQADKKDKSPGVRSWSFTVSEAEQTFKITRPTFIKAMALIQEIGFIERVSPGNYGRNTPALYRLTDKWKTWNLPKRDNSNMEKARSMRGAKPVKES